MILSMTGFGRSETLWEGKKVVVEMKSLNHRYLDVTVRTPPSLSAYEIDVKKKIGERFSRGKVDVTVRIESETNSDRAIGLNLKKAREYLQLFSQLKDELALPGEINLSFFKDLRDIFEVEDLNQVPVPWAVLDEVLEKAIFNLTAMRVSEGEALAKDIRTRMALIRGLLDDISVRAPNVIQEYRLRLLNRIKELLGSQPCDEARVYQEVAIMAEKSDITEELVRLASHLDQLSSLIAEGQTVGRKLDFLIQEMMREINTLGAKSNDGEIGRLVIEVKSELAKLREQVQNVE
ncbi:MAG TPA: YicC family protein [Syntrophales bacterium]|nr:YicC family protein [Syntrophales bacterium]HOL58914.1 YicC family protein [Syntrophales bacterium]HPO35241.1 YicC family protein [Syntrophales bacterium]